MRIVKAVFLYEFFRLLKSFRFYFLLFFSLFGSLVGIHMYSRMGSFDGAYVLKNVYFGFPIIIVALSIDVFSFEFESRHAQLIFSKPISRLAFILGKIFALIILFIFNLASSSFLIIFYAYLVVHVSQDLLSFFLSFVDVLWASLIPLSVTMLINAFLLSTLGTFILYLILWYVLGFLSVFIIRPSNPLYYYLPNVSYQQIIWGKNSTTILMPILYLFLTVLLSKYRMKWMDVH